MDIHVIIPVYNRCEYTRKCLLQLREQTLKGLKIIVIDDGSSDGTSAMISSEFPEVNLLGGIGNLYWTGAVYVGVEAALKECAEDDYILVLNDDLMFNKRFVEDLLNTARIHPNALVLCLEFI